MHPCLTPLPVGNHSVSPHSVLTVASCLWYRLYVRTIERCGTPTSFRATQLWRHIPGPATSFAQRTFPRGMMFMVRKWEFLLLNLKSGLLSKPQLPKMRSEVLRFHLRVIWNSILKRNNIQTAFLKDKNSAVTVNNIYYMYFNASVFTYDLKQTCKELRTLIVSNEFHKDVFYKTTLWFVQCCPPMLICSMRRTALSLIWTLPRR